MCSIVGSFNKDKIAELIELNKSRGCLFHSVSYYDSVLGHIKVNRGQGAPNIDQIDIYPGYYCIVHMQAPTDQKNGIHPAGYFGAYLWHNGIIKPKSIKLLNDRIKLSVPDLPRTDWDTEVILRTYCEFGPTYLSQVDGTFSCLMYYDKDLYLFRNEISPMFIDNEMNISSIQFPGSKETEPNVLFLLETKEKALYSYGTFKTANNPYFFAE